MMKSEIKNTSERPEGRGPRASAQERNECQECGSRLMRPDADLYGGTSAMCIGDAPVARVATGWLTYEEHWYLDGWTSVARALARTGKVSSLEALGPNSLAATTPRDRECFQAGARAAMLASLGEDANQEGARS